MSSTLWSHGRSSISIPRPYGMAQSVTIVTATVQNKLMRMTRSSQPNSLAASSRVHTRTRTMREATMVVKIVPKRIGQFVGKSAIMCRQRIIDRLEHDSAVDGMLYMLLPAEVYTDRSNVDRKAELYQRKTYIYAA